MTKRRRIRRDRFGLPKLTCPGCSTWFELEQIVHDPEVTIWRYHFTPWLDHFAWRCPDCHDIPYEFFDAEPWVSTVQLASVMKRQLGITQIRLGAATCDVEICFEQVFGYPSPQPFTGIKKATREMALLLEPIQSASHLLALI